MSSPEAGRRSVDPRLVEIQLAIAGEHPDLADYVMSLDLSDPETHLVLALAGGIIDGTIEVDLSGRDIPPDSEPIYEDATDPELIEELLDATERPQRNN